MKKLIWTLIEHEKKLDSFSINGAIASMIYNEHKGTILSQREYAKVWGWTRSKVRVHWSQITTEVHRFLEPPEQPTYSPLTAQNSAFLCQFEGSTAHQQPTNSPHIYNNTIPIPLNNPNKLKHNREPKTQKTRSVFECDSKPFVFSKRCIEKLVELDALYPTLSNNLDRSIQEGAGVFDKLNRIDGKSWPLIAKVMKWLLREDNWWIASSNFRTPVKLRKKNDEGASFFDVFEGQMQAESKGSTKANPWLTYRQMQEDAKRRSISFSANNPIDRYYELDKDKNMWRYAK